MNIREQPVYSFDDVLLVPQHSEIQSRGDVDLTTSIGKIELRLPIISANMDTVTEANMAIAIGKAGGAGILHRFVAESDLKDWVSQCGKAGVPRIISVGLSESDYSTAYNMIHEEAVDAICIDVAHGDHENVVQLIQRIRNHFDEIDIIAGNIATAYAAQTLVSAGANILKVGIGPGSVCSTRVVSGHGFPQLSAIAEIRDAVAPQVGIIADGGIRYPGDIVKALAAGADAVMIGSLLAGTDEAAGERIVEHGSAFKTYRGMASREFQQQKRNGRTPRVEGVSAKVPYRGPVRDTLANLEAGIRSGLSYSGANNIEELWSRAEFVVVTGNTLKENHPHHPYQL